jgi:membrane fusion protein (multidrug efflux system)
MIKRMFIMLLLCGLVLGGAFGYKIYGGMMMMKAMASMGAPAQTVSTMKVSMETWANDLKAVGTLHAAHGTNIAPEVTGTIEALPFESGQDVECGTVLLKLNSKEEGAALDALKAKRHLAELTLARDEKQLKAKAISQATYDSDKSTLDNLSAQIAQAEAALEKRTLRAPFSGRLGIRTANVGQYISAGTPVVSLQQLDPLYLDFTVPQQRLAAIQVGQKVTATTDAFEGKVFEGEISAIDAKVDETTRNINVRATIKNEEKILRPGLFASLSLIVGAPETFLTLPQTAITFNPYGSTVYLVQQGVNAKGEKELQAKMTFVTTGAKRGDQIAILDGIKEGDEIVTSGQMKLRNGTPVIINNNVLPTNDPAPTPVDR